MTKKEAFFLQKINDVFRVYIDQPVKSKGHFFLCFPLVFLNKPQNISSATGFGFVYLYLSFKQIRGN